MKATFDRKVLQAAFALASQASPNSTPSPVLKNVLLTATGPTAVLLATDNEVSIRVNVPDCETKEGGKVLMPAGRFKQILSTVESVGIDLATKGSQCHIKAGRSTLELATEDADTFPAVPEFSESVYRVIPGHVLKDAINRTVYAADPQSSRYALSGIKFDFRDNETILAATDSKRLSVVQFANHDDTESTGMNGVVPATACRLIERSLEGDEDVFVAITGNNIHVKAGNSTISARLVEGRFPDWEAVMPTETEFSVTIPCGELLSCINQAALVSAADNKGIVLSFDNGNLTFTGEGQDVGRSEVVLPVAWGHKPLSIKFDAALIVAYLKTLESTSPVELLLIDGNSAAVFFAGDGYRYVLMPLADN